MTHNKMFTVIADSISTLAVGMSVYASSHHEAPLTSGASKVDTTGAQLGGGVDTNYISFKSSFPYTALPHGGVLSTPRGNTKIKIHPNDDMTTIPATKCIISSNLKVGSMEGGVSCFQVYLISQELLGLNAPTGYFDQQIRETVADWQTSTGIHPAVGYFGKISRASFSIR